MLVLSIMKNDLINLHKSLKSYINVDSFSLSFFASTKIITIIIIIRTGESGEWDQHPQIHTNNSITSYQMTGLLPFTIYSFRVLAVNSLGISLPSKESYYIVTLREGLYVSSLRFNMIYAYDSLSQNYTINPSFCRNL